MDVVYKKESYEIIGACFEVYKTVGPGFLESVYQECVAMELSAQSIPFVEQPILTLDYKGQPLQGIFKPDFICCEKIILEIKAANELQPIHRAQVHNYLKATSSELGLLVNFCHFPLLEWERIVRQRGKVDGSS